ncbi:peptide deformylase [bacterium]|nr:peptide deformylase [bacterium]
MKIRIYGDPVLREPAEDVTEFGSKLEDLAGQMVQAMIEADGIGLAAPQVGLSLRFLVVGLPTGEDATRRRVFAMANPEIIDEGDEMIIMEEGCLSIPGISEEVERPEKITIRFQNLKGETVEMEANDILARVVQHEMDHLDGVLFTDRISPLKKTMLRGRLKRLAQDGA